MMLVTEEQVNYNVPTEAESKGKSVDDIMSTYNASTNDNKRLAIDKKIRTTYYATMGITSIGNIAGIIYANKTGGGFWRYVGFMILGGIIIGTPTQLFWGQPRTANLEAEKSQLPS